MKLKLSLVGLGVVAALYTSQAFSQDRSDLEVIQVNGTRLSDSPIGAISTLDRAQIEQINPSSTIDLLRRLPHVDIAENGNAGGFSYVSIRGGEFNFTLVTIDGIPVNDTTNSRGGGFDFNQINPSAIERIEVYRGGVNSIYGSDAISGVINIITRDATDPVVTLELGTDKQVNASVTASSSLSKDLSVLGSVSTQNKEVSDFEDLKSTQLLLKSKYQQASFNVAGLLTYNQADVSGFTEDSGGELFAEPSVAEKRDSDQILLALSSTAVLSSSVDINARLSWLEREETINNPGIAEGVFSGIPASDITSEYERLELDVFSNIAINPKTSLILGASQSEQDGSNRGFLDFGFPLPVDYDFSQDITSAYIEAQHQLNNITVEASARYDSPKDFDNDTSFRLGASYETSENSRVFAVFNQGYKLPSFFALAHPLVGNSELEPERSDNFEVGFESQVSDDLRYSIVYFENQFEDLVDFDAELFTNVNRSKVDTSGLELDFSATISSYFTLFANARYLDIDADQGVTLRKRPKIAGNLRLETRYKASTTSLFVDFRDDYADSSIATGNVQLPGYASVGVSSIIAISSSTDISVNVDNALGKRIEDSVGFIQDDVEARIGVSYRF